MKHSMMVEAQTKNAAETNNFAPQIEDLLPRAIDIALEIVKSIGSDVFERFVMCSPDLFKNPKEGIPTYATYYIEDAIDNLDIPESLKSRFYSITLSITYAVFYPIEECVIEMAERYRDEALAKIMKQYESENEYEYEDENIAWDRHHETE